MHSWRRGHYSTRRQESYFFFSLQWQRKGCFDFCCTNNKLYLKTLAAKLVSPKVFFTFYPNGSARRKTRKQDCNQHIFYLLMYCPVHLAVRKRLARWAQSILLRSGISAVFTVGESISVPAQPFPLCQDCQFCDAGFFSCRKCTVLDPLKSFLLSCQITISFVYQPISWCSWISVLPLNKPVITKNVFMFLDHCCNREPMKAN